MPLGGAGKAPLVTAHEQLTSLGPSRWQAVCSCGWTSASAWRPAEADARWRIHAGEQRAASCIAAALELRAGAALRALELAALRSATATRRVALREERWQLRSSRADGDERADKMHSADPAPWQMLNRMRSFIGFPVSALWLEYFASGGNASYEDFGLMLTGVCAMSTLDHDLTVTVLNDRFSSAGLGALVADSEDVLRTPLAGLQS
jgi:hypothetical protein